MYPFHEDNLLVDDREDLLALLRIRFGDVPAGITERLYDIDNLDSLQRLILIAANVSDWGTFCEELQSAEDSFKLVGERYQPLTKEGVNFGQGR